MNNFTSKKRLLMILILMLIIYGYDFINFRGYESRIGLTLFKMIVILIVMIGLIHKKIFKELTYQTSIDDYFKKMK